MADKPKKTPAEIAAGITSFGEAPKAPTKSAAEIAKGVTSPTTNPKVQSWVDNWAVPGSVRKLLEKVTGKTTPRKGSSK